MRKRHVLTAVAECRQTTETNGGSTERFNAIQYTIRGGGVQRGKLLSQEEKQGRLMACHIAPSHWPHGICRSLTRLLPLPPSACAFASRSLYFHTTPICPLPQLPILFL